MYKFRKFCLILHKMSFSFFGEWIVKCTSFDIVFGTFSWYFEEHNVIVRVVEH